jgi:hypothetical protein
MKLTSFNGVSWLMDAAIGGTVESGVQRVTPM